MLITGKRNLVANQNATFKLAFNVSTSGTPWNLTSYTGKMQVKQSYESTTSYLTVTDMTMDSSGNVSFSVDADTMAAIPAGRWVYDLKLYAGNGDEYRLLEGKFVVNPGVTN